MKRYLGAVVVVIVVAAAWVLVLPAAGVRQPIAFPHARHQGVACAVCHRGATTGVRAGLPSIAMCTKCHATAPGGSDAVWNAAVQSRSIRWVQVTRLPSHVMFSHRRHTAIGRLDCASCHGEVRTRKTPFSAAPVRLVMTTCLSCHRQQEASQDCAACHR